MSKKCVEEILNKNKDEIINLRLNGMQMKDIGRMFNLKTQTISSFLRRNGIRIRGVQNKETVDKIIKMYQSGMSMHNIGKELHFSQNTVRDILTQNNITIKNISEARRKYSIDEHYFDNIDIPNKAYILGLLYADGCRSKSSNAITINLQARDKDILEKINKEIKNTRPLRFIDYSKYPNKQNQYLLLIHNKQIAESLFQYGLIPNKEFKVKYPNWLDKKLMRHFIRGYMDGDGSISKNPKEKRASMTGTEDLLLGIKNYLEKELNVHFCIYSPHHKKTVTRTLGIAGGKQVKRFLDYIYKDADLYLDRKYLIYLNLYCQPVINNSQSA